MEVGHYPFLSRYHSSRIGAKRVAAAVMRAASTIAELAVRATAESRSMI